MQIPFFVPYFSLLGWIMGRIPQAPPPLSPESDGSTSQDSILFLGALILHLRHRITHRTSSAAWVTSETFHLCLNVTFF